MDNDQSLRWVVLILGAWVSAFVALLIGPRPAAVGAAFAGGYVIGRWDGTIAARKREADNDA
jgi:hypothetical protein